MKKRSFGQWVKLTWNWGVRLLLVLAVWAVLASILQWIVLPVFVRKGREVTVPELRGVAEDSAIVAMEKAGFGFVVDDRRLDPAVPAGHIIDQRPLPDRLTKPGRRIHVIVSTGAPEVHVPDVTGKTRQDAIALLQRMGLEMGELRYAFSDTYLEKQVISQYPDAHTLLTNDNRIAFITISLGKKPAIFEIPRLIGLDEEEARFLIRKAGLQLGVVSFERREYEPDGVIIEQVPEPGTVVEEGAQVSVIINQKEKKERK